MNHEADEAAHAAQVRDLAVRIGVDMARSGDAVGDISTALTRMMHAQGTTDVDVIVFPTAVIVKSGLGDQTGVQFGGSVGGSLRLDQVADLYEVVDQVEARPVDPVEVGRRLDVIETMPPLYRSLWRVLGHGLLTVGFALMLQSSPQAMAFAFAMGLMIGALKLLRLPTLQLLLPALMSFLVTIVVLAVNQHAHFDDPIRLLVPPLVTFLPGGALTIGTFELATGQSMSGAGRLAAGCAQLLLLGFGIVAGALLLHVPLSALDNHSGGSLGAWVMVLAIPLYAVGMMLQYCIPARCMPWVLLVLVAAYVGQSIGTILFGAQISGFFGGLAMTPLALLIERLPNGPPKLITFLPAFWMLVPGGSGLMAVVGLGASEGTSGLNSVLVTIVAITLGILVGAALFSSLWQAAARPART